MNYTQNYHLPQWVKEDRIMMEDFNAAMASMESGMTATAADSAQAVSTANAAHAIAQQTAGSAFTPDNMPYVTGFYSGGGEQTIVTGFRPSCVIVFSTQFSSNADTWGGRIAIAGDRIDSRCIFMEDNGFRLAADDGHWPRINLSGSGYNYIAFR